MVEKGSLKYVFAIKHGECKDFTPKALTEQGLRQMNTLAQNIRRLIPKGRNVILLSAPEARAIESASIIGSVLDVRYRVIPILSSDRFEQGSTILEMVLPMITVSDVAILVTNHEAPSGIMNSLKENYFKGSFPNQGCDNGNGFIINMKNGKVKSDLLVL